MDQDFSYEEIQKKVSDLERELITNNPFCGYEAQNADFFRLLLEKTTDIIWMLDMDISLVYVSPSVQIITGYSPDEVLAIGTTGLITAESHENALNAMYERILKQGMEDYDELRSQVIELVFVHKDGSLITTESRTCFIRDNLGNPKGVIGISRDISDRKKAEDNLRKASEELEERVRLRTAELEEANKKLKEEIEERTLAENLVRKLSKAMETTPEAIVISDIEGNIQYVNKGLLDMSGYTEDSTLINTSILDHSDEEGQAKLALEIFPRLFSGMQWRGEMPVRHSNGDCFPTEMICSAIYDNDSTPQNLLSVFRDITERKLTEDALRASEEQLRTLINSTPDIICFKDENGRWLEANDAIIKLFDLENIDYRGKTNMDLASLRHHFHEAFEECTKSDEIAWSRGEISTFEEIVTTSTGKDRIFEVIKVPLCHDNGKKKGIVVLGRDITERRENEEHRRLYEARLKQGQKMEAIGTLAGGIAHDFNNALAAIIGYSELIRDDAPEESLTRENIREVIHAGYRARDLVRQILTFSRQGEAELRPVQVPIIVKETLKMLRSSIPPTVEIRKHIDIKTGLVLADPTQVHQIIINLCTNAYHAMGETGGTLGVFLNSVMVDDLFASSFLNLKPGSYVKLTVSDTGQGISKEVQERIFDPFFTTKEIGKGTGLGLATVHGIVRSLEGAVFVDSAPGKGAVFEVYLPELREEFSAAKENVEVSYMGRGENILLVDDEKSIVHMVKQMLERMGYRVTAESSSSEALNIFLNDPQFFDLVITDQIMSGLTGDALSQELLRLRPDLPIILITGYSEKITEKDAVDIGIRRHMMKPIKQMDLAKTVRDVLDSVTRS